MKKSITVIFKRTFAILLALVLLLTAGSFGDFAKLFGGKSAKAMGIEDGDAPVNDQNAYIAQLEAEGFVAYPLYNFLHISNNPEANDQRYYRLKKQENGIYSKLTLDEWLEGTALTTKPVGSHCVVYNEKGLCMEQHPELYYVAEPYDFSDIIISVKRNGVTERYAILDVYTLNPSEYTGYYTVKADFTARAVYHKIGGGYGQSYCWQMLPNTNDHYDDANTTDSFHRDYLATLHKVEDFEQQNLYNFVKFGNSTSDYYRLRMQSPSKSTTDPDYGYINAENVNSVTRTGLIDADGDMYECTPYDFSQFSTENYVTFSGIRYYYRADDYVPGKDDISGFQPYFKIEKNHYEIYAEEQLSHSLDDSTRWLDGSSADQWEIGTSGVAVRAYHRHFKGTLYRYIGVRLVANSNDDTIVYDGQVHSATGYKVYVGNGTEPIDVTFSGIDAGASGTDAGTYNTTFQGTSFDVGSVLTADNNSGSYAGMKFIVTEITNGTLTISKRPITVKANDVSAEYTGSTITYSTAPAAVSPYYSVTNTNSNEGLASGQSITAITLTGGSGTTVGPYDVNITDGSVEIGANTANYAITLQKGTLTITPNTTEIMVIPGSGSKVYDGTPLTKTARADFTVIGVPEGFTWKATADGTVTNVNPGTGEKAVNAVTSFKIFKDNTDVTTSFENINTSATGTLTITPKPVTVKAQSKAFTYTGEAQSWSEYDVDGLVGNDAISAVVTGSITFPSESPVVNKLSSYEFTAGTPENYSVTTQDGQLTMSKASVAITITAASQAWTYDGSSHENTAVTVTDGSLLTGDELVATATGSVTNVADTADGNNPIAAGYRIMHGTEDVSENYVITPVAGKLTINPKAVTVTAQSKEFTYSGEAQSWQKYDVAGLVGDDAISAVVTGSITFPSESPVDNVVESYQFTAGTPENYSVTTVNGQLTMSNASVAITITAASDEWTYDGSTHQNTAVTVTGGTLLPGDVLVATATGSVTNVADTSAENNPIAAGYKIMHGTEDVTANYVITPVAGTLTINPRAVTITAASEEWTYDGTSQKNTAVTVTDGSLLIGDQLVATATGSVTDVADTADGNNPIAEGYKIMHGTEDVTANYVITPVAGKLTINPKAVTVTAQSKEFTYSGEAQSWQKYDVAGLVGDDAISAVVTGSITFPSESPVINELSSYEFTAGTPGNYTVTTFDGQLTMKKASVAITITAASEEWTYDGSSHGNTAVTVTGGSLLPGDELVATATGSVTNVADTADGNNPIAAGYKIMHGTEDVTANYVITPVAGTLTITPAPLTITAIDQTYTYNGYPQGEGDTAYDDADIIADKVIVVGLQGDDALSSIVLDGQESDIGEYDHYLVPHSAAIGEDGKKTGNYSITYVNGKLKILSNVITVAIVGNSETVVYDGKEHVVTGYTATTGGSLYDVDKDFTFSGEAEVKLTDVGQANMGLKADQFTNTNPNFTVTFEVTDGSITVEPAEITVTITGSSETFTYDGEEHTVTGYTAATENTVYDVDKDFTFSGEAEVKLTDAGQASMGLKADQFTNTNPNFTVTFEVTDGSITVVPAEITVTITGDSETFTYDGEEHTVTGYTAATENTVYDVDKDFTFSGEAEVKLTDAGQADMGLKADQFTNTNPNFNVTFAVTDGSITVEPAEITVTITGNSETFTYDGKEHVVTGYTASTESTVYDVDKDFTFSGKAEVKLTDADQANMGLEASQFTNANTNFTVTFAVTDGSIKVEPKEVTLSWTDTEIPYDGKSHAPKATVSNLVDGDSCDVTVEGAKAEIGDKHVATATALSNPNYKLPSEATKEFSIYGCTVSFVDEDGTTVLQKSTVPFGEKPEYKGETPTKEADAQYSYEFVDWSPAIVAVNAKETTYKAVFNKVLNEYTVTWKNDDGTVLKTQTIAYGTKPVYDGATPALKQDEEYTYEFAGWTPEVDAVTGDITYTATYKKTVIPFDYNVTEGENSEYVLLSGNGVKYIFKRTLNDAETFKRFKQLYMDGVIVESINYIASSGSLIIEFKPEYLDTLSVGVHVLKVIFEDDPEGVTAHLTILPSPTPTVTPTPTATATPTPTPVPDSASTGDTHNLTLWFAIGAIALVAIVALLILAKRRRDEEDDE